MGHYVSAKEVYKIKFRPGYAETDFKNWWMRQIPYTRDHSGSDGITVKVDSTDNLTKLRRDRFYKTVDKKYGDFLSYPDSYCCNAVLVGIVGWRSERRVRKVVDHHIKEVTECRTYKTKPTKGLKESVIYAIGEYVICYDGRDYDPLEH
jgi:hypothetical protein